MEAVHRLPYYQVTNFRDLFALGKDQPAWTSYKMIQTMEIPIHEINFLQIEWFLEGIEWL